MAFLIPLGGRTKLHQTRSDSWVNVARLSAARAPTFRRAWLLRCLDAERVPSRPVNCHVALSRGFPSWVPRRSQVHRHL